MLFASSWPPSVTASNTSCRQKPSAMPISTCCTVMTTPGDGEGRHVGRASRSSGATMSATAAGEHDAHARRHGRGAERRRHHEARADAHERPEDLGDPGLELSGGERDHGGGAV